MGRSILSRAAGLVGAALLGGALVLGSAAFVFDGGETVTVRELETPAPGGSSAIASSSGGGDELEVKIYRGEERKTIDVTLGQRGDPLS